MLARVARRTGASSRLIEACGVGASAVLILALRAPFAIGRLWAEDGSVFLRQSIQYGVVRPFGRAYAGYYLFVPRLIGAIASGVPIREAALTTWLCVAAVVGWCAATIYAESEGWLATFPTRALLALSIVLLPALGLEAIGNSSNLQYTLLFTALVALTGMSTNRWSSVNRVAIVTVTALTTPLALFLAPVAALRVLRSRPRHVDATTLAWALATVVQFTMILVGRPPRVHASGKGLIVTHYNHWVLYGNLLPKRLASSTVTIAPLAAVIGAFLVVLAAVLAWRRPRRATAVLLLLVPAVGFAFWMFAGTRYGLPVRYRVFPALCVIWSVLVAWEELLRAFRPRLPVDWRLSGIVVLVLVLSWVTYWRPAPHRSSGPAWSVALSTAERRCRNERLSQVAVTISPVKRGSKVWAVQLPCHDIE